MSGKLVLEQLQWGEEKEEEKKPFQPPHALFIKVSKGLNLIEIKRKIILFLFPAAQPA